MGALRVLIVDDQEVVRRGVRALLLAQEGWSVCGEGVDGLDGVEKAKSLRPDVVIMDISMPRMDGVEATRIIRREVPSSDVVVISQNDPNAVHLQADQIGARAFVPKTSLSTELVPALERIAARRNGGGVHTPQSVPEEWLLGGGTMGRLIWEYDWSQTPIGPIQSWPQSLKTSVNLMLNSQHPMWIGWGPEMIFLYNDAYISVLSLAKHPKSLGLPAREVWAEIWDVVGPLASNVFVKGEPSFVHDMRLFMSRGDFLEETYYSFSYSPIHDESGRVAGLFCPSTETSAKILNARRLRTLSELSSKALVEKVTESACASSLSTLENNPDDVPFSLLYLLESDGQSMRLEGTSRITRNLDGISPFEIALEGPSSGALWPLNEVIETAHSQIVSVRHLDSLPKGPARQPVAEAIVLPLTARGQERPIGVLIAGINPTRKLDTEHRTFFTLIADQVATAIQCARGVEEERRRADSLAEISRAKTVFFSNVSHEFRTPLTLMLGPIEDMLAKPDIDVMPENRETLTVVRRNCLRLQKLVNTLLDLSRLEAGRTQPNFVETDLAALTSELASMFEGPMQKAGMKFTIDCKPLPQPVFVDRDMWEKIVSNLLSNAFKFTFEGEVRVSMHGENGLAVLTVSDSGTGIPAAELPNIFQRFHRVQNSKSRTHEGTGIGLALVQELVQLHGGKVEVESELDRGTTFRVLMPVEQKQQVTASASGPRQLASTAIRSSAFVDEALTWLALEKSHQLDRRKGSIASKGSEKRERILLAEDNADMRDYIYRLLEPSYDVEVVSDGLAALDAARKKHPDLILTDVMMPEIDGFELVRQLRADEWLNSVPIVVLSARAGEAERTEGISHGADDYLTKPFSANELLTRVAARLELATSRKHIEEALRSSERRFREMVDMLPAAVYTTDADGLLTHFNPAAIEFSGRMPEVGTDQWCVSWKLYRTDGSPLPHDQCPMAIALKEGRVLDGQEIIAERPDGTRRWFAAYPRPLHDAEGNVIGGVNMLLDITERKQAETATNLLAAIVDSSDDAIVSKNLNGVITSWNQSAERLFGYTSEEAVGKNITLVIPPDRYDEEAEILRRLARGERVEHFETVRRRKDGSTLDVALTISPVKDSTGRIVGASKVARDVSEKKAADRALRDSEERYRVLASGLETQIRARTRELEERNAEIIEQAEQLRELSSRLLQTQDDERRRIARELHDSVGQIVTALSMNLAKLNQRVGHNPLLAKSVEDSLGLVQQLSKEMRTMSYLLHPPLLDENGLSEAIPWYIQGLTERSGLKIELDIAPELGRLPREMELAIFRIIQECLTNIHRHSGSDRAKIRIERNDNNVSLEIRDKGKGIPKEKLTGIRAHRSGVGFTGMRERIRHFRGDLRIQSGTEGTTISVILPVPSTWEAESAARETSAQG